MMKILKLAILVLALFIAGINVTYAALDSLLNVTYGKGKTFKGNQQSLTLDVFFPIKEVGKKYPLVLLIHGGGFLNGSKEAMKSHCKILADSGFIAVSMNYRKGWDRGSALGCNGNILQLQEAVYRATQDGNAALRFLVENQQNYAIDTAWIFVGGSSAGGVMALNLAYLKEENVKKLFPEAAISLGSLNEASNTIKPSFSIKGICNMWGAISDSTLITTKNALPTILYHGTNDMVVPFDKGTFGGICKDYPVMYGSACIYRQTINAGKAAIINIVDGANHGPKEFYSKITMSNTACFFKQVMRNSGSGGKIYHDPKAGCR